MDTQTHIDTRADPGEAAVSEYLDIACVVADFDQDPAVRGLRAVLTYGKERWNAPWDELRTSATFRHEAKFAMSNLVGEVLHYWMRWDLKNYDSLQRRVWALRGQFEKFDFQQYSADDVDLAALKPSDVAEVIARMLADVLLCAERLRLNSGDIFKYGQRGFVGDVAQLKFEQPPRAEQEAHVALAALAEENLIADFRPHGESASGTWAVQENPLDRKLLPTEDVAAYVQRRRELLGTHPGQTATTPRTGPLQQ